MSRAVEAGRLDQTLAVTSRDEIGLLTTAFNRMVGQLRLKERLQGIWRPHPGVGGYDCQGGAAASKRH
jgi:hypothetical protein